MGTRARKGWWLVVGLLAVSATGAVSGDGLPLDGCRRRAVRHARVRCSDGFAACDLDEQCDATCVLAWCADFIADCRPKRVRLCRIGEVPAHVELVRAGRKGTLTEAVADNVFTRTSVRCRPAKFCAPEASICEITLAGAVTATSPCRAGVLYDAASRSAGDVVLTLTSGEALEVHLGGPPDVGTFESGVAPFPSIDYGSVAFGLATAYVASPTAGGSLKLELTEVKPSASFFHRAHGTLDATLVPLPAVGGAALEVHATF